MNSAESLTTLSLHPSGEEGTWSWVVASGAQAPLEAFEGRHLERILRTGHQHRDDKAGQLISVTLLPVWRRSASLRQCSWTPGSTQEQVCSQVTAEAPISSRSQGSRHGASSPVPHLPGWDHPAATAAGGLWKARPFVQTPWEDGV